MRRPVLGAVVVGSVAATLIMRLYRRCCCFRQRYPAVRLNVALDDVPIALRNDSIAKQVLPTVASLQ